MRRLLLTVALLTIIPIAEAQSQPPPPSGGKEFEATPSKTGGDKSKANLLERGTSESPLVVKVQEPEGPKQLPGRTHRERIEEARPGWWADAELRIAYFTCGLLLIALIQLAAFIVQLRYMGRGIRDAKLAADTARDSAEATKDSVLEMRRSDERQLRAYISFRIKWIGLEPGETIRFKFLCINHGRTPAMNLGFRAFAEFHPKPVAGLKSFRQFNESDKMNVERANIFPSATTNEATDIIGCDLGGPPQTDAQLGDIIEGRKELLLALEIEYWDVFSPERRTTRAYFSYGQDKQFYVIPRTSYAD